MPLFPAFLKLAGRRVVVVGGGRVAASKIRALADAGADVTVIAPAVCAAAEQADVRVTRRPFQPADLDGVWLAVAAATPEVNKQVADAAEQRRVFVNAVDDPPHASLYLGGVVRRAGVTFAISTDGRAPALAGLLRQALDALMPAGQLERWMAEAIRLRRTWRAERVPFPERRPQLLDALVRLHAADAAAATGTAADTIVTAARGFVSLVGAGPGDPSLLTVKATRRLDTADLLLYDGLVPAAIVALAPRAQRFSVGKRAGRKAMDQETIHRLMIRAARRGKRVVRLKCGDPFVLGRGGEEALALRAAAIPFEVVPGVTSVVAAPQAAGIPLTHRGLASGFAVVSGHAEEAFRPLVAPLVPNAMTLVVLMGVRTRGRLAETLLDAGWRPDTPVAVVTGASQPEEQQWVGRLDGLGEAPVDRGGIPGTIVIGDVVALGSRAADDGVAETVRALAPGR